MARYSSTPEPSGALGTREFEGSSSARWRALAGIIAQALALTGTATSTGSSPVIPMIGTSLSANDEAAPPGALPRGLGRVLVARLIILLPGRDTMRVWRPGG